MQNKPADTKAPPAPSNPSPAGRLLPVPAWPKQHAWPSEPGLRWLIFNAKTNGFDSCIRRVGRRVLIDETAFFQWVERQSNCTLSFKPNN